MLFLWNEPIFLEHTTFLHSMLYVVLQVQHLTNEWHQLWLSPGKQ